jgi:hypothetical protein
VWDDKSINLGVRAAIVIAWNGLLRVSEYTADPDWARKLEFNLLRKDIEFMKSEDMDGFRMKLKSAKADRYNQGEWQYFERRPGDKLCPVHAMEVYLNATAIPRDASCPAFMKIGTLSKRGKAATRRMVLRDNINKALKKAASALGMDTEYISSHSLRIGGAYTMADGGSSLDKIQQRGRWSARGFNEMALMYMRMSASRMGEVSRSFCTASSTPLYGRAH